MPDNDKDIDKSKRRLLRIATSVTGAVGACAAAVPLIKSLEPDAAVKAASITTVDIAGVAPGTKIVASWLEKPVFIVRRTPEMLGTLDQVTPKLLDPNSKTPQQPSDCRNVYRALKPEWLIMMAVCTHLCCTPVFKPAKDSVAPGWLGGFHCPCHGSFYDLSGRVFKGVPAPLNLVIPEYEFFDGGRQVRITGLDPRSKLC